MQNLEPLLIFITVAEMGSFTLAADSLGIQKGRASTAVRKLEEDVGVRLLHRTTRSVQLTEDGRAFHARARDLLAEVDDLHSMFAGDRVALRGRLTGRSSDRSGTDNDRAGLAGFHGDSSRVGARGVEYGSASRSGSRGVRLCIAAWTHRGRDADCPPAGPVAHGQRCQSRLSGALWRPSIAGRSPASGTSDNSFFDDAGRKTLGWEYPDGDSYGTLQLPGALHVNSAQTYEAAALAGLGLIQAPLLGIGRYLESGALVEILPDFRRRSLAVSLVVAHRRNLSRRVRAFMKWIEDVLAPIWNSETKCFVRPAKSTF